MSKEKKIRVFLGGYVNSIQAQDLNCRALAMFLDKTKFDVSTFLVPQQFKDFDIGPEMGGVKLIQLNRPARLLWYWIYLRGIAGCDIAYLPKGQKINYCKLLCRLFRKKTFNTVEGVIDGTNYEKSIKVFKSDGGIRKAYGYTDYTYSITKYMEKKNKELLGIKSDGVLYLGVDAGLFERKGAKPKGLRHIVFIGNNMRYKGVDTIFVLAEKFPALTFHIVGEGMGYDVNKKIEETGVSNVVNHGKMNHNQLSELLAEMDLHVFPSRSEGFPKVTLETAAAGVPSLVFSDYGADEWIETGKNGYVVDTLEEMAETINRLLSNPEELQRVSEGAVRLAERFDWRTVVKDWEKEIERIVKE